MDGHNVDLLARLCSLRFLPLCFISKRGKLTNWRLEHTILHSITIEDTSSSAMMEAYKCLYRLTLIELFINHFSNGLSAPLKSHSTIVFLLLQIKP